VVKLVYYGITRHQCWMLMCLELLLPLAGMLTTTEAQLQQQQQQ
jgi:hypothetical protein